MFVAARCCVIVVYIYIVVAYNRKYKNDHNALYYYSIICFIVKIINIIEIYCLCVCLVIMMNNITLYFIWCCICVYDFEASLKSLNLLINNHSILIHSRGIYGSMTKDCAPWHGHSLSHSLQNVKGRFVHGFFVPYFVDYLLVCKSSYKYIMLQNCLCILTQMCLNIYLFIN